MIAALTVTSLSSFAINTEDDSSRGVSDIMYLPEAGTISTGISITSLIQDSDITYLGPNYSSTETKTKDLDLSIGYSVNDNFSFGLEVPFTLSSDSTTTYGPASVANGQSASSKSSGLQDLNLIAKYRILDQKDSATNLDLTVEFSPKTGDSESASTTTEGNAFRGGSDMEITLEFGKKYKELQFRAYAGLMLNGETETKDLSDNTISKREAFTSFNLGGEIQFRPTEQLYLNTDLGIMIVDDFTATLPSETQKYSADPVIALGLTIGYDFTSNATVALGYAITKVSRDITVSTVQLVEDSTVSQLKLSGIFQF